MRTNSRLIKSPTEHMCTLWSWYTPCTQSIDAIDSTPPSDHMQLPGSLLSGETSNLGYVPLYSTTLAEVRLRKIHFTLAALSS